MYQRLRLQHRGIRTADDGLDGGNIHVFEPIVVTESSSNGGTEVGNDQSVITLDPLLADSATLGKPMVLTATIASSEGVDDIDGRSLTLHSKHESGAASAVDAVSDALGMAVFTVSPLAGETAHWVTLGDHGVIR